MRNLSFDMEAAKRKAQVRQVPPATDGRVGVGHLLGLACQIPAPTADEGRSMADKIKAIRQNTWCARPRKLGSGGQGRLAFGMDVIAWRKLTDEQAAESA